MATSEIYELTHPEILSENRLKEILESRCIDFNSTDRKLSKSELIELYKRVALPLPRRESKNDTNTSIETANEPCESFAATRNHSPAARGARSAKQNRGEGLEEDFKEEIDAQAEKRLRLDEWKEISNFRCRNNENNIKSNRKNNSIEKQDFQEAPLKKRQKITWP